MADEKKPGFFKRLFGFGRSAEPEPAPAPPPPPQEIVAETPLIRDEAAERIAAEIAEAKRQAAERAELERAEAERAAAAARAEADRKEAEAAARKAEQECIAREKAEDAARKAEEKRLAAERAAADKAAAKQAEADRKAAEKDAADKAETERRAAEAAERQARARAEAESWAAEAAAAERAEVERLALERAAAEKAAAEQADAERRAAEAKAAQEKAAQEKAEEEQTAAERAEADRRAAEKAAAERLAAEQAEAARQAEADRSAREQAETQRIAAERAAAEERASVERAEAERAAAEKAEAARRAAEAAAEAASLPAAPAPKQSWWQKLKSGLSRTAGNVTEGITSLFTKRKLDDATLEELEDLLIQADLGIDVAARISAAVGKGRYDKEIEPDEVKAILAEEVAKVLKPVALPLDVQPKKPFVLLMIGVNGSGKTTTIGKLASKFRAEGRSVMLAAGDTFRAAAIEQLKVWGQRTGAPVVARDQGGDAAGLAFDAVRAAQEQGTDVLLIDTAGRLQNRTELMAELEKVIRVIKKLDETAPHATLLVLDATVGQNAISQVDIFGKQAGVTGLVMTKLDGTARGGILVALAEKFKLPIHFIGVGEGVDDLEPFEATDFARAIAGLEKLA
jgi:fused signal recognition particle receptor